MIHARFSSRSYISHSFPSFYMVEFKRFGMFTMHQMDLFYCFALGLNTLTYNMVFIGIINDSRKLVIWLNIMDCN
jgi:hypothetical protein